MQKYQSTITATNGSVIRNVPVTVLKEDGSLAEIFMDREGQVQALNPLVTDSRGVFYFYAKNGRYSLRTAADGVQITDADTVLLFDPDETASDGPIADAVRRAEDAAERAETALGDSGLQNMVQDAQDAAANAAQAVIDAHQAVASIDAALIEVSEAKEDAQAAAQTASTAASDAQAVKDSLLNYDGTLSATPEWSAVPAHEDSDLDAQTQAALNRIEKLKEDQQQDDAEVLDAGAQWSDVPKLKGEYANAQAQALANRSEVLQKRTEGLLNVRAFIETPIDGVTSNQEGIEAAVAAAYAAGAELEWPAGVYVSDANIPNFHDVQHSGKGVIKRGSSTYRVKPSRDTVRVLYVAPDGSSVNDGIDASRPITIGKAIAALDASGPIRGRQQIVGAPGVYSEIVAIPRGLALNNSYLEFKFPSSPGVRGDPENWPVDGAILDGAAFRDTSTHGFDVGAYNNVSVEYLLFRGWKRNGVADTSQVKNAVNVNEFANLYLLNCCGFYNGWCNVSINPRGRCVITGGDYLGARYVINNTGGRLSFTATASTYTRVRGGLEYGLYQKHDSSTVMDYTEFSDNGKHPAAVGYGAAVFAYKSNASVDTRGCKFYRNNIDFNLRGGVLSTNTPDDNVYGVGADASSKRFLVRGNGSDDMQDWQARGVREINRATGGSSFSNTTPALIHDPYAEIRSGYFCDNLQRLDIDVLFNVTNAAATLEPSLVTPSGRVPILTTTSEVNEYARLLVSVRPVFGEASLSYTYSYYGSSGIRHGHGSLAVDARSIPLSVVLWGLVGSGGSGAVRDMRVQIVG